MRAVVDIGPVSQEQIHKRQASARCGRHEGGSTPSTLAVHWSALLKQHFSDPFMVRPIPGSTHKWRDTAGRPCSKRRAGFHESFADFRVCASRCIVQRKAVALINGIGISACSEKQVNYCI